MTPPESISMATALWVFGGLLAIVSGLVVYVFAALTKKVDRIEAKLDEVQSENHEDHQRVVTTLARVEQAIIGIDRDVQRHDKEITVIRREVDDITRREL